MVLRVAAWRATTPCRHRSSKRAGTPQAGDQGVKLLVVGVAAGRGAQVGDGCGLEFGVLRGCSDDPGRHAGEMAPQQVALTVGITIHVAEQGFAERVDRHEVPGRIKDH
jgi:hypothetical protein